MYKALIKSTKIITLLLAFMIHFGASAQHYKIHSVTKGVTVRSGSKTVTATTGMTLTAADQLLIPKGGKVEILNQLDKRIYSSVQPGQISVTKLLIDARRSHDDKAGTIGDKTRFMRQQASSGRRVYVEKGMVSRSLGIYDPDGKDIQMEPSEMARLIVRGIRESAFSTLPDSVSLDAETLEGGGACVRIGNSLFHPIYVNMLTLYTDDGTHVEISQLGQPGGSYVLLPSQSITREQTRTVDNGHGSLLVITPCQYDLDAVIGEINKQLSEPENGTAGSDEQLPVYIVPLKL